jgi:uncharacterized protein (TIGR02145 family)
MKQLLIFIFIIYSVNFSAQVTIGALAPPHAAAVLDLSQIPGKNLGLLPPGVELEALDRFSPLMGTGADAAGMVVYNKKTDLGENIYPGIYVWDGAKWSRIDDGATLEDAIKYIPSGNTNHALLSGETCFDVMETGAADGKRGTLPGRNRKADFTMETTWKQTYTLTATSDNIYNVRFMVVDPKDCVEQITYPVPADLPNGSTVTLTVNYKTGLNSRPDILGTSQATTPAKVQIYAIYDSNGPAPGGDVKLSLTAKIQDGSCCWAKTSVGDNDWRAFMCYNIGADPTKSIAEQIAYSSAVGLGNLTSEPMPNTFTPVYGSFYQWGRQSDGHQHVWSSKTEDQITGYMTSDVNFVIYNSDWLKDSGKEGRWGGKADDNYDVNYPEFKGVNDPCPVGWRVPSKEEWNSLFLNVSDESTISYTANSWIFRPESGNSIKWGTSVVDNTKGLQISPDDGTTVTLFLPAAGVRLLNGGSLYNTEPGYCNYWSSTVSHNPTSPHILSYSMQINNTIIIPTREDQRALGGSVRCIAE